jgi:hypothetical protein
MKQPKFWRHLWHIWVIGTVVWAVIVLWQSDPQCLMQIVNPPADNGPWRDRDFEDYASLLITIFSLPALIGVLVLALRWGIAGFSGLRNLT